MPGGAVIDDFRQTYLRLCKDHHIDVQECVVQQVKSAQPSAKSGGYCLSLSTHSLTPKTCAVLAKVFASDRCFTDIRLNDCMLPEEGVKALAHGLTHNVVCKKFDLKGNNIRGTAAEALGRMLRQNSTLTSLCLEWNSLGMLETAFSVFCEGLGTNTHLHTLDLRNNQLSHDGATELGGALRRNKALRILDLRWNNIGLLGGRAMIEALHHNKTLTRLELAGNNTPTDIVRSIETSVSHNADQFALRNDYEQRTLLLSREIQTGRDNRSLQITDLLDKVDRQEAAMRKSNRSTTERIGQLQSSLHERKTQFSDLAMKLSLAESELTISETRLADMSRILQKTKTEQEKVSKHHQVDLQREREEKAMIEAKLNKELIEATEKRMQLENKLDELDRRCHSQQEQQYDLKEQLAHTQAEHKLKATQFDERVLLEKQKTKEAYKEAEEMKHKEVDRVRKEMDEMEGLMRERIQKHELQRIDLEEEASRLRSSAATEKLHTEEAMMSAKQRIRNEEDHRYRQLEDKMRLVQTSRDELTTQNTQQVSLISELQMKNTNVILECETYKRRVDELNQDLAGKNNEMLTEVGKVKIEMSQRIQKLEQERKSQSDLYDRINKLETQLAETTGKFNTTVQTKDNEIAKLSDKLRTRESEITQINNDDAQRAAALQTALQSYMARTPYSPR